MSTNWRPTAPSGLVRVGDAERNACIDALIEAHVLGQLSAEELRVGQGAAMAAVTAAELAARHANLPHHIPKS
jgi:hypothetical protein